MIGSLPRIAVLGSGYVGLTVAVCLADLGNSVIAVDRDRARVRLLRGGDVPFYEPGVKEALQRNVAAGRLDFAIEYGDAIPGVEFAFVAVPTPELRNGAADVRDVEASAKRIAETADGPLIVVNKSTVPIGTADLVARVIGRHNTRFPIDVVSNPEFLREGSALFDFMHPDRVVIGAKTREVGERVARLYEPLAAPVLITDVYSAEMIKYASNALLATRLSLINEIARICERVNADIKVVAEGMGLDHRIGASYLEAGLGFGGSCLPKDVRALTSIAQRNGLHPELLSAVVAINRDQRLLAVSKLKECLGSLRGKTIALWGLAFKPDTDDLRQAPSVDIAAALRRSGARVRAYDPAVRRKPRGALANVSLSSDAYAAAAGADGLVLVTEWNEFRQLDLARVRASMRQPVLIDGRNVYDPAHMKELGFIYRGIGRH